MVWTPTSPSGCHSGSWGTPKRFWISGKCTIQPVDCRYSAMRPGWGLLTAHFMNSSAMRSRARVEYSAAMERDMAAVPASTVRLKRQANCMPRRTRKGSSEKASLVARRTRLLRSTWPPKKSHISPAIGSKLMALMVKSRREAASRGVMEASKWALKSRWPGPVLLSRRGTLKSQVILVNPGLGELHHSEALADQIDAAAGGQECG